MTMFVIRHKLVNHLFLQEMCTIEGVPTPIWRSLEVAMRLNFAAADYINNSLLSDTGIILPVEVEDMKGDLFNGDSLFDDSRFIKPVDSR